MTLDHPWSIDGRGRTAATDHDEHIRDLIEQVLLTSPGERVMRPDFGAGLLAQVFEPGDVTVAATTEYLVQSALERTLANLIAVERVQVESIDSALIVTVVYVVLRTRTRGSTRVTAPAGGA
jgi:phage baseplate assembly protein W